MNQTNNQLFDKPISEMDEAELDQHIKEMRQQVADKQKTYDDLSSQLHEQDKKLLAQQEKQSSDRAHQEIEQIRKQINDL